jgi:hypothetical protein
VTTLCGQRSHARGLRRDKCILSHTEMIRSRYPGVLAAVTSIRQHTLAYVSIRQHTCCYEHTYGDDSFALSRCACCCYEHTSAYVSIRQHTSAYVSMRAVTSIRQHTSAYVCPGVLAAVTSYICIELTSIAVTSYICIDLTKYTSLD